MSKSVWYLSHPVAGDEKYSYEQNLAHILKTMRVCFDAGLDVIAPYHTHCLGLDDSNPQHRIRGLECDCKLVKLMGKVIMTGHKMSAGMECERDAVYENDHCYIYNFTGYGENELKQGIKILGLAQL